MALLVDNINERQTIEAFEQVLKAIEDAYLNNKNLNHKREKCLQALRKHMQMEGDVVYTTIPRDIMNDVQQELEDRGLAHVILPGQNGEGGLLIGKKEDRELLEEIELKYKQMSTNYVKELTASNILDNYIVSKDKSELNKKVDVLEIKDPNMAMIAEKRLHGASIVFAKMKGEDGSTKFLLARNTKYNDKGKDLNTFELYHAFEQAKAEIYIDGKRTLFDVKKDQHQWDKDQLNNFANAYLDNKQKNYVLVGENTNKYLEYDANEKEIFLYERDSKDPSGWSKTKAIKIAENATAEEVSVVLSKYAEDMHGAFCKKLDGDFKVPFDDFKNRKKSLNELFLASKNKPARPINENTEYLTEDIKDMLDKVNRKASEETYAHFLGRTATAEEKYKFKKTTIKEILKNKDLEVIKDFLKVNDGYNRRKIYMDIVTHYNNESERENPLECVISKDTVKNLKIELANQMQREYSKNKEKSEEKGENKEKSEEKEEQGERE